jgi:hypothetical protein
MVQDAKCLWCEAIEMTESLIRLRQLLGQDMEISRTLPELGGFKTYWHYLTPLEIIHNKPHPSILLHIKDATMRTILILYLQYVKRGIIFRQVQHMAPRREKNFNLAFKLICFHWSTIFMSCFNIRVSSSTVMHWPFYTVWHKLYSMIPMIWLLMHLHIHFLYSDTPPALLCCKLMQK